MTATRAAPSADPAHRSAPPPHRLAFDLPPELEATEPPEARGLSRDAVRLMVAHDDTPLVHSTFALLPSFLDPGDLVVVNTSGTRPAAVDATASDGTRLVVHLSTHLDDGRWVVEPRRPNDGVTERWEGAPPGPELALAGGAHLTLAEPFGDARRLWVATLTTPGPWRVWLGAHGRAIRYGYVERQWPLSAYQSVYVTDLGSAEMPSAGRPFTAEIITRLVAKGVGVAPVVLHTGVASLEADELPYPERALVPEATAAAVNRTRAAGGRVVAIGTTVVRSLESAADGDGIVTPFDSWTDLVITPERGVRAVDGLLTGWHEPEASHLLMLEAIAGPELLHRSYEAAIAEGYLWHEFGDTHLLLP
ncbi:MAG: S-adenosylmethionine:tRNA ribosyltransferase-isomerase [Iamia sp.]